MTTTKLDDFTTAYIEAMLFSSTCEPFGECSKCNTEDKVLYWNPETREHDQCLECAGDDAQYSPYEPPADDNYSVDDLADETLNKIFADCERFKTENETTLDVAECSRGQYSTYEQAGHDFWLTRCGHGAGFWDGDWKEPAATELDNASKAFGNVDLYVGDDGKLYLS